MRKLMAYAVPVVCERCGKRFTAPKGAIWPVGCPQCTGDAAPSWWFAENNPDRRPRVESGAP